MRILPSSKQVEFINSKIRFYRGSLLLIYTPTRRVILNLHKKIIASMSATDTPNAEDLRAESQIARLQAACWRATVPIGHNC